MERMEEMNRRDKKPSDDTAKHTKWRVNNLYNGAHIAMQFEFHTRAHAHGPCDDSIDDDDDDYDLWLLLAFIVFISISIFSVLYLSAFAFQRARCWLQLHFSSSLLIYVHCVIESGKQWSNQVGSISIYCDMCVNRSMSAFSICVFRVRAAFVHQLICRFVSGDFYFQSMFNVEQCSSCAVFQFQFQLNWAVSITHAVLNIAPSTFLAVLFRVLLARSISQSQPHVTLIFHGKHFPIDIYRTTSDLWRLYLASDKLTKHRQINSNCVCVHQFRFDCIKL